MEKLPIQIIQQQIKFEYYLCNNSLAKDIANNQSEQSTAVNGTTLTDTTPPSVPQQSKYFE